MTSAIWETAFSGPVPVKIMGTITKCGVERFTCTVTKDTVSYKKGEMVEAFYLHLWKKVYPDGFGHYVYEGKPRIGAALKCK